MNEGDVQFDPAALGDELMELVVLYLEGRLTGPQRDRLNSLLAEAPSNRDTFVAVCTHASLLASCVGIDEGVDENVDGLGVVGLPAIDGEAGFGVRGSGIEVRDSGSLSVGAAVELPHPPDIEPHVPEPRTPSPEPPFPVLPTTHYPLPTSDFVGSWAFSYMVATAIVCVMLLGFWAYKITHYQHIAEAPSQSAPSDAVPEMVFVGRITGMVDVKWSDDSRYLPPPGFAHVPLGRKYILSSGLLEITYDSGAKVILQGPCTYEVESTASGYLSLGKLTARVGARGEGRGAREGRVANQKSPSSFILHPSSLFSVRTPTAVVTDLGTEFGVEVDKSGGSRAHVFQGKVEVRLTGGGGEAQAIQLGENESARVERAEDRLVIVRGAASEKTARFIRAMPRPKPAETVRIVETFDGVKLSAAFEQMPPGRYVFERGAAEHPRQEPFTLHGRQSRGYIRTAMADFFYRDFVFEATFHVRLDGPAHAAGPHCIFFGLGDGVPNTNFFDVVTCGLVLDFCVDNGQALVRRRDPDSDLNRVIFSNAGGTVTEVVPLGGLGPGRHRFRLTKTGRCVKFAVDADFKGKFQQDFISRPIDLPTAVPLLDATNSRLLVGTGNCDVMTVRFEELSVTYSETPK